MSTHALTVARIAEIVGGSLSGEASGAIESVAPLDKAGPTDVTFAADAKRLADLPASRAGAAIVGASAQVEAPMPLIRVLNVQEAVARLLGHLASPEDVPPVGVDASAHVDASAEVPADARIGPNVVIGARTRIGSACVLCAGVRVGSDVEIGGQTVLREGVVVWQGCRIGAGVRIGPNSVIGYDGFGYYFAGGRHNKVPHIGNVVIEDDVEIGACTCVDRAKFGSTRIGAGTKIDNLVQVAHNVQTGRACLLAALVGIAGSTKLGNGVVLGGSAGVRDNVTIGDGVVCGAYSAIANDIEPGRKVLGIPAIPGREKYRQVSYTARLAELFKQVADLEKRLTAFESSKDH